MRLIEVWFRKNGCELVNSPEIADVIIVETCAFVKRTEDISIREIQNLLARNLPGRLIVTGCLPGINMPRLRDLFQGPAINTVDLEHLNEQFPEFKHKLKLTSDVNVLYEQQDLQSVRVTILSIFRYLMNNFHLSARYFGKLWSNARIISRAGIGLKRKLHYLRISWGCEEPHCTFCVEWWAVGGKVKSKPLDVCLDEVKQGLNRGSKHLVICADNPGAWGLDIGKSFPELLKAILDLDPSIIISKIDGIHPYWMGKYAEELVDLMRTGRIKSIMSALQSGNNRILELMNRGYTREQFLELMKKCRKVYPDIILITQIIVGFPSETFEEFKESVNLVIEADITNVTLFPFYCNPGTPAAKLDGKICDEEKYRRIDYALKCLGRKAIFSFNMGIEINPKYQKTKAIYDRSS